MTNASHAGTLGGAPVPATGEHFAQIARLHNVVIEEITSSATPETEEYRQEHDEWVVVLAGEAEVEVAGVVRNLATDDWVLLPAGIPHRVLRTTAGTRWLAVHVHPTGSPERPGPDHRPHHRVERRY